jgi:anti-anti-sigma factor
METLPRGTGKQLEIHTETTTEATVLHLAGEVDLVTAPMVSSTLKAIAEDGCNAIVNLSGLRYMDSSGFKALFDANQLFLKRAQRLVVSGPSAVTRKVMGIIGFDQIIPVFPLVEAAREFIRGTRAPRTGESPPSQVPHAGKRVTEP